MSSKARSTLAPRGTRTITFALLSTLGCASSIDHGYTSADDARPRDESEVRVWSWADMFDADLERSGRLYEDEPLRLHLQNIVDELYPEFVGAMHVRLERTATVNAFMLPNGSAYVSLGLLALMDSDAQLAAILAHEGAHFVERGGIRALSRIKKGRGDVYSRMSFSRGEEQAADDVGLRRYLAAGYAPGDAQRAFARLRDYSEAVGAKDRGMLASHPSFEKRIDRVTELTARPGARDAGRAAAADFLSLAAGARFAAMEASLAAGNHEAVLFWLEDEDARSRFPDQSGFFLGEALRRRGDVGDLEQAEKAYRRATVADPPVARAFLELGRLLEARGDHDDAREHLRSYVRLAPDAPDRALVEDEIKMRNNGPRGGR